MNPSIHPVVEHIVTDWVVSRKRIGKHVPIKAHPTIEVHPLLRNRPVNTSRSNEYAKIGCPLLGNAWVDTPGNNRWYPLLRNWYIFCEWSVPRVYRGKRRSFRVQQLRVGREWSMS
jgi:hypothetical protein